MGHESAHAAIPDAKTTTAEVPATSGDRSPAVSRTRSVGLVGVIAGMVGASTGLIKILYPASVDENRYSFPFDAVGFTIENLVLAVQHLGLALLVWGLWRSGAAGRSSLARMGAVGTAAAWVAFAAVKVVATAATDERQGSAFAETVDGLSGLAGTLIGLSCAVLGIAVIRAQARPTWFRYLPLTLGLFVFVAVIPSMIFGSFTLARLAIIAWMTLWAALGWALSRSADNRAGAGFGA